jgi:4'-phosphopantetheinyl transferase
MLFTSMDELPATESRLDPDEIHLWCVRLDAPASALREWWCNLSDEEKARAARFRFENHRRRFIASRGAFRTLAGRYLGLEAKEIELSYGVKGKPSISEPSKNRSLQFNLSHSGDLALFAFTLAHAVGVDLERLRDIPEVERVAAIFLSPAEQRLLRQADVSHRARLFLGCWTKKESYLKALGEGLIGPLMPTDVTASRSDRTGPMFEIGSDSPILWSLYQFFPRPEYVAALAIQGRGWRISSWSWEPRADGS